MRPASEFEQLVDAHYVALYRFAYSLCRNEADASDLTQQTFYLWASKGHHQLRDASRAKTWLFTTLYREFLASRRREDRFSGVDPEVMEAEVGSAPAPQYEPEELDAAMVLEALNDVDPLFRAPLTLFYLKDLSYKVIAEVLQVPIGTVMSRLSRGKLEMRRKIGLLIEQRQSPKPACSSAASTPCRQ